MHNTGNPLGSTQVLDLYDNSENIDHFANSQLDEHPDRFGVKRLTLAGLIKRSMALRNEINDFSGALMFKPEWTDVPMNVSEGVGGEGGALNLQAEALGNRSEINKIISREALRRSCAEAGYALVTGSFEAGGTLVNDNDALLQERTGKAFSGPAGTVAAGTDPAGGVFVDVSNSLLRTEFLKRDGDIMGWGAVCDGVTADDAAIADAIVATNGNIRISKPTFVSTHVIFNGFTNPTLTFVGRGMLSIGDSFAFLPAYRGIVVFDSCHDPVVDKPVITGARVDKLNAPEPWEDGDSGIEYINCTGKCLTRHPKLSDFKAWGIIHIDVEDYQVVEPDISHCLVQSGIGGTRVRNFNISNPVMDFVGLYGVENETTGINESGKITGGTIRRTRKAISVVGNSLDTTVSEVTAIECTYAFSTTRVGNSGLNVSGNAINCFTAIESVRSDEVCFDGVTHRVNKNDVFFRVRPHDFLLRVEGDYAVILDREPSLANLTVGTVLRFDDETEKTVTSITMGVIDPIFGRILKFQATPSITALDTRKAFLRKRTNLLTSNNYAQVFDGDGVTIENGTLDGSARGLESFGSHANFTWRNNFIKKCIDLFVLGSAGSLTGISQVNIQESDVALLANLGFGDWATKFSPGMTESRTFHISGGTINALHRLSVPRGYISRVVVVADDTVTSTGTIVLKVKGVDICTLSGVPLKGSGAVDVGVAEATGNIWVQLVDTNGTISGSGYSVTVYGAFLK